MPVVPGTSVVASQSVSRTLDDIQGGFLSENINNPIVRVYDTTIVESDFQNKR